MSAGTLDQPVDDRDDEFVTPNASVIFISQARDTVLLLREGVPQRVTSAQVRAEMRAEGVIP